MKKIVYFIVLSLAMSFYISCNDDDNQINRLNAPLELTASCGDTVVFLKWTPVNGSHYLLVRGLEVIADSLFTEEYIDLTAPDTLAEYRIYAVDYDGWRSATYAADSGYMGIPDGILPRVSNELTVSTDNAKGCELSWEAGRFATSYEVYKNGELDTIIKQKEYFDYRATTSDIEYQIYSVNDNGTSSDAVTAIGRKGFFFKDDFESYDDGRVIEPWTFVVPGLVAYYTENNPTVTSQKFYSGSKSLLLTAPKTEIMLDWGCIPFAGYYKASVKVCKPKGDLTIYHEGSSGKWGSELIASAGEEWVHYEIELGHFEVGGKFKVGFSPDANGPVYLDDICFEYSLHAPPTPNTDK